MCAGVYGMYALQKSTCPTLWTDPEQMDHAEISACHGAGGMFSGLGTVVLASVV